MLLRSTQEEAITVVENDLKIVVDRPDKQIVILLRE
jgi:hypothetical protein